MGFWDITKRLIQGKPAFEVPAQKPDIKDPWDPAPEQPAQRTVDEQPLRYDPKGNKILPQVAIISCDCRFSGQNMQVWATVQNQSKVNVYLDRIVLCNATREYDYPLAPGQTHDLLIYDGPRPTNTSACYSDVFYRDRGNGDYFALTHFVTFRDGPGGTYYPVGFKPLMPRDV